MKAAEFCLLVLLAILPLWVCPTLSNAVELNQKMSSSLPAQYDDLNYVCLQFKGFPLGVLWKLRALAPTIRQQLPDGLHVGLEKKNGQGSLVFSYQKKPEGVLVSMRYQGPTVFHSSLSVLTGSPSQLNQQLFLSEGSNAMVIETLKDLFIRFCVAWEKDRIPSDVEEIVSSGIRIANSYPDRFPVNPFAFNP